MKDNPNHHAVFELIHRFVNEQCGIPCDRNNVFNFDTDILITTNNAGVDENRAMVGDMEEQEILRDHPDWQVIGITATAVLLSQTGPQHTPR